MHSHYCIVTNAVSIILQRPQITGASECYVASFCTGYQLVLVAAVIFGYPNRAENWRIVLRSAYHGWACNVKYNLMKKDLHTVVFGFRGGSRAVSKLEKKYVNSFEKNNHNVEEISI